MRRPPEQRCVCLIHQRGQAWSALELIDRNLGHLPLFSLGEANGFWKRNWLRKRERAADVRALFETYQSHTDSPDEAGSAREPGAEL